jgi:hypothetical protein
LRVVSIIRVLSFKDDAGELYQLSRLAESSMALEHEWWKYFMIPWIAGFVGYATNVRKSLCIGRK